MTVAQLTWNEYAERWAGLHGGADPRTASPAVRTWLRGAYALARVLARAGVPAMAVTVGGLVLCLLVPLFAAAGGGWLFVAGVLVLLAAVADTADGAVAVITSSTSRLGHVYDAVADRLGEACWLVALWLLGGPGWLVTLCGALAWLHEYTRARAAMVGMSRPAATVGGRPVRVALVVATLAASGAAGLVDAALRAGTVTVFLALWAGVALTGANQLNAVLRVGLLR